MFLSIWKRDSLRQVLQCLGKVRTGRESHAAARAVVVSSHPISQVYSRFYVQTRKHGYININLGIFTFLFSCENQINILKFPVFFCVFLFRVFFLVFFASIMFILSQFRNRYVARDPSYRKDRYFNQDHVISRGFSFRCFVEF